MSLARPSTWFPGRPPRYILGALAADAFFSTVYLADALLQHPIPRLSRMMDLNGEVNFPTWWAVVQWFAVGACVWIGATHLVRRRDLRSWLFLFLTFIYLGFSLDEAAQIHEGLGARGDLVVGVSRTAGQLQTSGVFLLLFGTACLIGFWIVMWLIRPRFAGYEAAWRLILIGTTAMLIGAVWIDFTSNFLPPDSFALEIEVLIEETTEFVGSTTTLWGAYLLARGTTLR